MDCTDAYVPAPGKSRLVHCLFVFHKPGVTHQRRRDLDWESNCVSAKVVALHFLVRVGLPTISMTMFKIHSVRCLLSENDFPLFKWK